MGNASKLLAMEITEWRTERGRRKELRAAEKSRKEIEFSDSEQVKKVISEHHLGAPNRWRLCHTLEILKLTLVKGNCIVVVYDDSDML